MNYTNIFYTVPITNHDTMVRNNEGVKVDLLGQPIKLPRWTQYQEHRNTSNTPLLGAIARKDFIGIDIDNLQSYNVFKAIVDSLPIPLQPTYMAESLPTQTKGGHFLFSYDLHTYKTLKEVSKYLKKHCNVDIQIDMKLIYLATKANQTKELLTPPLNTIQDLTPMHSTLLSYLLGLAYPYKVTEMEHSGSTSRAIVNPTSKNTDYYGHILDKLQGTEAIISILTPKSTYPKITHPNQVKQGSGTDWLLQIRRKLQMDVSVSDKVFQETLLYINSLWDSPMPTERIISDCKYDIHHQDWVYDSNWKARGLLLYTRGTNYTLEILYEPSQDTYIVFNRTTQHASYYRTFASARDAIRSQTLKTLTKEITLAKATPCHTIDTPLEEPFLQPYSLDKAGMSPLGLDVFNLFKPTEGLQIVRDPSSLKEPREPKLILDFLANLFPAEHNKHRFLQYLAHKYSTYDYSPLYYVMAGVGGAGKGVLVNTILKYLSGEDRIKSIGLEQLIGKFNSYQLATDWLELEEAGEGYTHKENEKLVGALKKLTGNKYIQVERKGVDQQEKHRQFLTPIISTNLNTKLITDTVSNDRRLVLLKCPNKMLNMLPYESPIYGTITSTTKFLEAMEEELPHFAHYLGTMQKEDPIPHTDYMDNTIWKDDDYMEYINDSLDEYNKLLNGVEECNIRSVVDALIESGVPYSTIDELFSVSTPRVAQFIAYRSPYSMEHRILTLEDIVDATPKLRGIVRKDFKRLKSYVLLRYGEASGKVHMIRFGGFYNRLEKDSIPVQPIEGETIAL